MVEAMIAGACIFMVGFTLGCVFMVLVSTAKRRDDG